MPSNVRNRLSNVLRRVRGRVRRHVPPGFRWPVGLILIAGGILGFLPVLGFWMIPLGVTVAAMDVLPVWRYLTGRKKDRDDD